MKTDGRFYTAMTGPTSDGNSKYSGELKKCIEQAGELCLGNLHNESYSPIMLLGSIQSGKTRAFMGLMSLCFDNDFDMTIILTKCSKALVQQTVSRMTSEFDEFRTGNATVGDVVAQDILDIDFKGKITMTEKEDVAKKFLQRYRGKKRIVVVKKQADNVDRMNMFIEELVKQDTYKRVLIVDDEADITSIGYEKVKDQKDISLRRVSGAINTMRKRMQSKIEHVLMQVTATPYALYLQPENFTTSNIMPVKPTRTVVLPTGKGYIGGHYYFIESEDETAPNFDKAQHLLHVVNADEMNIINGSRKNSGKNVVIKDGRTVKMENFVRGQSTKSTFVMPSLRSWLFDILVGAAIIQNSPENEGFYVSAVLHAATTKELHKEKSQLLEIAVGELVNILETDISDKDIAYFVKTSYDCLKKSVAAYSILDIPTLDDVKKRIATISPKGKLEGLITEIDIKEVNSDTDIETLLNNETGELKLENSITIFVGGQVLDRGITIPNLISFFYGRNPVAMQQDTVMQHCRMFGYRNQALLSVTRLYTTSRLFRDMKEITIRDEILRSRMSQQESGDVIYLEAGGKIKACSPQKVLASKINTILPEKRYLPVGFDVIKKDAKKIHKEISDILHNEQAFLSKDKATYRKGDSLQDRYVVAKAEIIMDLLRLAYDVIDAKKDGLCNVFSEIESVFWFSLSERMTQGNDEIALIVRENRSISKMKRDGGVYQDAPDDGNNEGALAKILRENMPVLILTEQTNKEWGEKFWWPVYYTPADMNVGIYSEEQPKTGVSENMHSMMPIPVVIGQFPLVDNIGADDSYIDELNATIEEVVDYHQREFYVDGITDSTIKRTKIECRVYIDGENSLGSKGDISSALKRILVKAEKIIKSSAFDEEKRSVIMRYFSCAAENDATDELRESALATITSDKTNKVQQTKLKQLLFEMDDLLNYSKEVWGLFIPLGSGKCEIRLYYKNIEDECKKLGYESDAATTLLSKSVIAHEIFHALHYADIMTESGRWLYRNKDVIKQGAVVESLAEYFTLCYSKRIDDPSANPFLLESHIRNMRDVDKFPKDGGYSGALILESREKKSKRGKNNEDYAKVYEDSLRDMPKAYMHLV